MSDQPTGSLPPPSGTKLTWNEVVSAEPKSTTSNDIFGAMPDFPGEIEEPKPRKEDAASPTGEQCPYCPDQGWYVEPNRNTGEPEQVQCEWCNTNPNSVYNQPKPTGARNGGEMILNDDEIQAAISLRSWARRSFPEVLSAGRGDPSSSFNYFGSKCGGCIIATDGAKGHDCLPVSRIISRVYFSCGARSMRGCRARVFLNFVLASVTLKTLP